MIALRWRWGWLALPLVAVAAGLGAWQIGFGRVADAALASQALGGADQRVEIWSRALYMLQDFPFTGIGMGAFRQVANLLYPFFLAGPDAEIPHAHNIFLQVGVDLGLPGLVAWLALLILVCVCAWLVYRRGREAGGRGVDRVGGRIVGKPGSPGRAWADGRRHVGHAAGGGGVGGVGTGDGGLAGQQQSRNRGSPAAE